MGERIEWAEITEAHLVTEDDEITDHHGTAMDPGNVGIAAGGCLIQGTRDELLRWAQGIVQQLTADDRPDDEDDGDEYPPYPCPEDSDGLHSVGCGCEFY
jgi:hypothetical protein